jgi:hypothetical protein
MNKQNHPPDQEELENLLRQIRPNPSRHFYQKMEKQPWNKPAHFLQRNWLSQYRLAAVFSLLLLLGLVFLLATPSADVLAFRIAQFFTAISGDTVTIAIPIPEFEDSGTQHFSSAVEAARLAGFEVKTPSLLPQGLIFSGAAYHPLRQSVMMNYESGDGSILRITQRPASLEYQRISVNASVEKVQINGVTGEYVAGGWRVITPLGATADPTITVQAAWDSEANIHFLRWQEADILFEILFSSSDLDSPHTLDKDDLVAIAENLR